MTEIREDIMIQDEFSSIFPLENYPIGLQEKLKAFSDLKFGLFIHWGIYSQWDCIESWPLVEEDTWARPDTLKAWADRNKNIDLFRKDYRALNKTFNPVNFDPEKWADIAESAGMKYVCFTTKHHDGFCMFDTQTTDYKITNSDCPYHKNPKSNVTKVLFDAFRKKNMPISCYFSKSDWDSPYYWQVELDKPDRNPNYDTKKHPEIWNKFVEFVHAQVKELMTEYGAINALWLDGGQVKPPDQDIKMDEMVAMAREFQPNLIVADRTVGGINENIITPEQQIPDKPLEVPWESCLTIGDSWSYVSDDTFKSSAELITMLVDIVAKGGNFLLNVGPSPTGEFPEKAITLLAEMGDWLKINGEAIYATKTLEPYADGNIRYTQKGSYGYAIVIFKPEDNKISKVTLNGFFPKENSIISMLGSNQELTWTLADKGAEVILPSSYDFAPVIRFEL